MGVFSPGNPESEGKSHRLVLSDARGCPSLRYWHYSTNEHKYLVSQSQTNSGRQSFLKYPYKFIGP